MVFEPCKSGKSWMFEDSEQLPSTTSSPRDSTATSDDSILDLSVVRTLKPTSNRDILGMILKNLKVSKINLDYFQNTYTVLLSSRSFTFLYRITRFDSKEWFTLCKNKFNREMDGYCRHSPQSLVLDEFLYESRTHI